MNKEKQQQLNGRGSRLLWGADRANIMDMAFEAVDVESRFMWPGFHDSKVHV